MIKYHTRDMIPSSGMSYRALRAQHQLPQQIDHGEIVINNEERTAHNAATKYASEKGTFPRRMNVTMCPDMMVKGVFKDAIALMFPSSRPFSL